MCTYTHIHTHCMYLFILTYLCIYIHAYGYTSIYSIHLFICVCRYKWIYTDVVYVYKCWSLSHTWLLATPRTEPSVHWIQSMQGPSVLEILQARILEWVATAFSEGSSQPRNWNWVSCTAGRFFTIWANTKAPFMYCNKQWSMRVNFEGIYTVIRWEVREVSLIFLYVLFPI